MPVSVNQLEIASSEPISGLFAWQNERQQQTRRKPSVGGSGAAALPAGYATFLADLKARVRSAQLRATVPVNRELIVLYWDIGQATVDRQKKHKWSAPSYEPKASHR